jgi:hypothetical protein
MQVLGWNFDRRREKDYHLAAMKSLLPLVLLFSAFATFGQEPDRWHGLVLDEATPEQAIAKLGKPQSEKSSDKMMNYRNKSLREMKSLRILHWEKIEGFEDIKLYFADGTLAIIQLEKPKNKIPADVFIKAYGAVEFQMSRNSNYEAFYEVEAVTPRSTITAGIGNAMGSVAQGLGEIMAPPSSRKQRSDELLTSGQIDKLQGHVVMIFLQSHRMDDKRGTELLK